MMKKGLQHVHMVVFDLQLSLKFRTRHLFNEYQKKSQYKMDTTETEAARIVTLLESGQSQRAVARTLSVSRSSVQRVYRRYLETGGFIRRQGSGRRRATTQRDDRYIVSMSLRNRHRSGVELRNLLRETRGVNVSEWTVRRRLREASLTPHKPATGPQLTRAHRVARLQFAREHVNWTLDQWKCVLITDESRMKLHGSDGRNLVYRRAGERYAQCAIAETVAYGGGSVMFWAGFSYEAKTELVFIENGSLTADRYIREILEEHVVPFSSFIGENFVLLHDNARPHAAASVSQYIQEVGVQALDWPARSPDLNPIEHVWDELKRRVRSRQSQTSTIQDLKTLISEEWEAIPQETLQKQVKSFNNRCKAIIKSRGGNTPY